ncbi:MAG: helix-turn-helix transcriptional regulator [Desulfobacterales bacterium]|nr:helix-turn-helix transcriptional regulator [Desulfobacterales bacterium]
MARGYTQKELACKVNISPQQIQRYEATGYSNISFKKALKFADALGVKFKGEVSVKQGNGPGL